LLQHGSGKSRRGDNVALISKRDPEQSFGQGPEMTLGDRVSTGRYRF
jgi:hypothetical protein